MPRLLLPILVSLFACLSAAPARAQKISDAHSMLWLVHNGDHRLSENWGVHTELQIRRADFGETWQQLLVRPGVNYYLAPSVMITLGAAWIRTWPYGAQPAPDLNDQFNIFQQLFFTHPLPGVSVTLSHRYRFEERWLERLGRSSDGSVTSDGYQFQTRMRYRLGTSIPLNREVMSGGTVYLALADEVFLNMGGPVGANVFDQNRIYAGFGWKFSEPGFLELGYQNQLIQKSDGRHFEDNHMLMLSANLNLDLR